MPQSWSYKELINWLKDSTSIVTVSLGTNSLERGKQEHELGQCWWPRINHWDKYADWIDVRDDPEVQGWILQEHFRDIRDDPEVLDPPKHIALALACTCTDIYTIIACKLYIALNQKQVYTQWHQGICVCTLIFIAVWSNNYIIVKIVMHYLMIIEKRSLSY